jgi:hypothetical protein
MFSVLRRRFGVGGTLLVVALIFATIGGAYAASGPGLSAKQKKQVEAIAKALDRKLALGGPTGPQGPAGAIGAPGPAGPQGSPGEKGTAGEKGATGPTGATGKSVLVGSATVQCEAGGITVEVEGSPTSKKAVCNGKNGEVGSTGPTGPTGSPWPAGGVLPPNATEMGTWSVTAKTVELFGLVDWAFSSFSFPIPLSAGLEESHTHIVSFEEVENETVPAACDNGVAPKPSVEKPEADSGQLCVFVRFIEGAEATEITTPSLEQGVGPTGGVLKFSAATPGVDVIGVGSYAVTG